MKYLRPSTWRVLAMVVTLGIFAIANIHSAHAACTDPVGEESRIVFNDSTKVLQYCNGTNWVAMGRSVPSASGSGCSNPTKPTGAIVYNGDYNVLQFCNSENWMAMGPFEGGGGGGPQTFTSTFDSDLEDWTNHSTLGRVGWAASLQGFTGVARFSSYQSNTIDVRLSKTFTLGGDATLSIVGVSTGSDDDYTFAVKDNGVTLYSITQPDYSSGTTALNLSLDLTGAGDHLIELVVTGGNNDGTGSVVIDSVIIEENWMAMGPLSDWHSGITYSVTGPFADCMPTETGLNNESVSQKEGAYAIYSVGGTLVADLGSAKTVNTVRYGGRVCAMMDDGIGTLGPNWGSTGPTPDLEYSNDGSTWTTIASMPADYSASVLKNYTFADVNARYFRLFFDFPEYGSNYNGTGQFRLGDF